MTAEPRAFPPITELVPHLEPMLALDELVEWEPGRAVATTVLRPDQLLVGGEQTGCAVTLELMAQGVAACLGLASLKVGEPFRHGMVVACRRFTFEREVLRAGERLTIEVRCTRATPFASNFDGWVREESGAEVAAASFTLVHSKEPPNSTGSR